MHIDHFLLDIRKKVESRKQIEHKMSIALDKK